MGINFQGQDLVKEDAHEGIDFQDAVMYYSTSQVHFYAYVSILLCIIYIY